MSIVFGWTWVREDTRTQVTSEYIKCTNWMSGNIKKGKIFWDQPLEVLIYLYFIVLILIGVLINYAWKELFNLWLLPIEDNLRSITMQEEHWRNNTVAVIIIHNRMIDGISKKKIKSQSLETSRLLLLAYILAISQKYLRFYPPYFFNIYRAVKFFFFSREISNSLCRSIYR